jgi:hypothetical protein
MMRIKSSFFDSRDVGICSGGFPFTYLAQRDVRDGVTDVGDVYLVKASLSDHLKYVLLISSVSVKPSPLRYLPRDRRKLIGFECTQRKSESPKLIVSLIFVTVQAHVKIYRCRRA